MASGEEKKFNSGRNDWWVIQLGLAISAIVLLPGIQGPEGFRFPPEQYISAAAFVMLISTAILQNIELSKQREDLALNRRALELQVDELQAKRGELASQTKEFEASNDQTRKNIEQQQFYELLKMKETLYVELSDSSGDRVNRIAKFNNWYLENLESRVKEKALEIWGIESDNRTYPPSYLTFEDVYTSLEPEEKENLKEELKIELEHHKEILLEQLPYSLYKLYSYHLIIENTSRTYGMKAVSEALKEVRKSFTSQAGYDRYNKFDIYNEILTDEETTLFLIIKGLITIDRILPEETPNK